MIATLMFFETCKAVYYNNKRKKTFAMVNKIKLH